MPKRQRPISQQKLSLYWLIEPWFQVPNFNIFPVKTKNTDHYECSISYQLSMVHTAVLCLSWPGGGGWGFLIYILIQNRQSDLVQSLYVHLQSLENPTVYQDCGKSQENDRICCREPVIYIGRSYKTEKPSCPIIQPAT